MNVCCAFPLDLCGEWADRVRCGVVLDQKRCFYELICGLWCSASERSVAEDFSQNGDFPNFIYIYKAPTITTPCYQKNNYTCFIMDYFLSTSPFTTLLSFPILFLARRLEADAFARQRAFDEDHLAWRAVLVLEVAHAAAVHVEGFDVEEDFLHGDEKVG